MLLLNTCTKAFYSLLNWKLQICRIFSAMLRDVVNILMIVLEKSCTVNLCFVQHCWIVIVGRLVSSIVDTRLVLNLWNCEERCFYDNWEQSWGSGSKNVCNFIKMFEKNCLCLFVLPERQGMGRKEFLRFVPCILYPQCHSGMIS